MCVLLGGKRKNPGKTRNPHGDSIFDSILTEEVSWIGQIVVHFLEWGRVEWNLPIGMERMDEHGDAEDFES